MADDSEALNYVCIRAQLKANKAPWILQFIKKNSIDAFKT